MIKAVIFDIDNTIYDYDAANKVAFAALTRYAREEVGLEEETFLRLHRQAIETLKVRLGARCASEHNRLLRYQALLELAGKPLEPHALAMESLYWGKILDVAVLSKGLDRCVPALKRAGYRLGVGTDMTVDYQLKKLTRLGLLRWLDFVVTSEEVLAEKPSPKLFALCAEKAGVKPEECLFIGDNLEKDIQGAQAAGMQALWYQPDPAKAAGEPDVPSIQDFDQLSQRLGLA